MLTSARAIADAISDQPGLPWSDDRVRAQSEHYYPGTWRRHWPDTLPVPPSLANVEPGDRARATVTRTDIFNRAESVTTEADALDLYVLMCGWGAGWQGLTGYRSRRPLTSPDVAAALLRSYREIREGGDPVAAYRNLHTGQNKIKFFGPAFFTKWLYFAGYDSPHVGEVRPLILDARVARTLGWATADWRSADYARYLDLANEAASLLSTTPHVIEHALYALNGGGFSVIDEPESATLVLQDVPTGVVETLTQQADDQGLRLEELVLQLLAQGAGVELDETGPSKTPS